MMKPNLSPLSALRRRTRPLAGPACGLALLLILASWSNANINYSTSDLPKRGIVILPGTNAPIPLPTPSLSDSRRRLRQIDLLDQRKNTTPLDASGSSRAIADIAPEISATDISTTLRMQRIRVAETLKANNTLFRTGRQEEAIQALQHFLDDVTESDLREKIWTMMGVMRFKQLDYTAAATCFEEARLCNPHSVSVTCNLAAAYMSDGKLEEAEALLSGIRLSLIEDPKLTAAIQFNLACIGSILGRLPEALEHLSQAARLNPAFTGAHLGDTQLDNIRNAHRFKSIARQIDLTLENNRTLEE
ncbi:MAG: tetratricopeptide repeat protein [Kiritimatiellae bacterium]|nr:tetratricopeptide repeat protein [Kiritimatiellia bacterium]